MIFVTVGTHEQPFNRLIQEIDNLKIEGKILEDVFIQRGFSTYTPKLCQFVDFLPHMKIEKLVSESRIVITHGGPSSFLMPLQIGKIPIVVPRQKQFGEHVNNHQLSFAKEVEKRQRNIIVVENINTLGQIIDDYESKIKVLQTGVTSNNSQFNVKLSDIVNKMFE